MAHYLLWLIAGVVFLGMEALGVTGVGLMFAGLGALTTGSLVTLQPQLSPLSQSVIFLATTAIWALLLYKPLQKFRGRTANGGYRNMIGDTAYIGVAGLKKGSHGEATWSGTIMRAELADGVDFLSPGSAAEIVDVVGNTLLVKPKS